jgi:hypothetical protein
VIVGVYSGDYEDGCLLGCSAVWTGRSLPKFQRCVLIALMTEAASICYTSVNFCWTTRRNNPEDSHLNPFRDSSLSPSEYKPDVILPYSLFGVKVLSKTITNYCCGISCSCDTELRLRASAPTCLHYLKFYYSLTFFVFQRNEDAFFEVP